MNTNYTSIRKDFCFSRRDPHMRKQRNIARLSITTFALATLMIFAVTSYSGTRSRSFRVAKTNGAPITLTQLQTAASKANGKIAFVSNRDGNLEIYTTNAGGSGLMRLTFHPEADLQPVWSPDGTRIAFTRKNMENQFSPAGIFVMNADGSEQRRLTPSGESDTSPNWSPDGTQIAFGRAVNSRGEIFVMNADGSDQRRLTDSPEWDGGPVWSPDGTKIAFLRGVYYPDRRGVMNADGSDERVIQNDSSSAITWSPDSSKFAVGSFSHLGIAVINVESNSLTQFTSHPFSLSNDWDSDPSWSPDGSKIVFARLVGCDTELTGCLRSQIWVVNVDGGNPRQLIDESTAAFNGNPQYDPAWSPDGAKIVFRSGGLFVMNADGGGISNITGTENPWGFSWQALSLNQPSPNPIDDPQLFVRQHYLDFLGREPDPAGLAFWTNEITSCGADQQCLEAKRVNVSVAFFLSIEFQQTGYLVYRIYKSSYGDLPGMPVPIKLDEFSPDTQRISQGVIVNQTGWEQILENNKQAFTSDFVQRSRFTSAFPPSMTPAEFVDKLFANAGLTASGTDYLAGISEFGAATNSGDVAARARALRMVAESPTLAQQDLNRAFVLMQYFGYLRRNPNDLPDSNFDGYYFWLNKLDQFNGNYINAQMVKAFIVSIEYRQRFGP
jgi:Tol biopolymer transport system component